MIKNRLGGALRRRKGWAWLIWSFLAVIFVVPSSLWALEPKSKYPVEYVKDKLTINAEDVAVGQLLNILGEKAGIEFRVGQEQSERRLTVRLGPLPLVEGLKRLLREFSYTFFFGPGDRLVKVFILDNADPGGRLSISASVGRSVELLVGNSVERPVAQVGQRPSFESSTRDGMVIEPSTRERVASPPFTENEMAIKPPVVGDMMVTSSAEKMVIAPPVERGMVVNSPTAPMHIEYHSGVSMPVKGYTGGVNFSAPK